MSLEAANQNYSPEKISGEQVKKMFEEIFKSSLISFIKPESTNFPYIFVSVELSHSNEFLYFAVDTEAKLVSLTSRDNNLDVNFSNAQPLTEEGIKIAMGTWKDSDTHTNT